MNLLKAHQFKDLLSRIELLLKPLTAYQDTPNLTNLNGIGQMLKCAPEIQIQQDIDEGIKAIRSILDDQDFIQNVKNIQIQEVKQSEPIKQEDIDKNQNFKLRNQYYDEEIILIDQEEEEQGQGSMILEEEIDENYEPTQLEIRDYANFIGMELPEDNDLMYIAKEGLMARMPESWKPYQNRNGETRGTSLQMYQKEKQNKIEKKLLFWKNEEEQQQQFKPVEQAIKIDQIDQTHANYSFEAKRE